MTAQQALLFACNREELLLERRQTRLRALTVPVEDDPTQAAVSWVQSHTSLTDGDSEVVRTGHQIRVEGQPSVPVLPSETNLTDLAEQLGITRQSFRRRLNRGLSNLLQNTILTDTE